METGVRKDRLLHMSGLVRTRAGRVIAPCKWACLGPRALSLLQPPPSPRSPWHGRGAPTGGHPGPALRQITSTGRTPVLAAGRSARLAPGIDALFARLKDKDRAALAKAITLVESSLPAHKALAQNLMTLVLEDSKTPGPPVSALSVGPGSPPSPVRSFRIGLSGSPGVGKSSFIERFGLFLIAQGLRVAVLAVDPSSSRTGGSILGDKTRMTFLSRADEAFVRPSPTSGTLGGVARNTTEAILLCEAAGYDVILVETVGVGQSETMVADMVDMFTLLVAPASGDELQGLKKGIVELVDMILINKSDGHLVSSARLTQLEYTSALKFLAPITPKWKTQVMRISSIEGDGVESAWKVMREFLVAAGGGSDYLLTKRAKQS